MKIDFSVVIPLYNKAKEIVHTLEGVASQRYAPMEVIVVDDGSTDGGAELVEQMKAQLPTLQLIRQANGGVSVARNCGIAHARGNYIALLDADDVWKPEYLERVTGLIERYPGCGMYCMGFEVHRPEGVFPNETGMQEGVVANYFRTAMHVNLTQTSSVTIPRAVFEQLGGFPEGMKLGEDQYVWTKIARNYPVCYSPQRYSEFTVRHRIIPWSRLPIRFGNSTTHQLPIVMSLSPVAKLARPCCIPFMVIPLQHVKWNGGMPTIDTTVWGGGSCGC